MRVATVAVKKADKNEKGIAEYMNLRTSLSSGSLMLVMTLLIHRQMNP